MCFLRTCLAAAARAASATELRSFRSTGSASCADLAALAAASVSEERADQPSDVDDGHIQRKSRKRRTADLVSRKEFAAIYLRRPALPLPFLFSFEDTQPRHWSL